MKIKTTPDVTCCIQLVNSIVEISNREWDALSRKDVFLSYGWLKSVEQGYSGDVNPRYFLAREGEKIAAGAVCYLINKTTDTINPDDALFGRIKPVANTLGVSFLPAFKCGPVKGYGTHLLTREGMDADKVRSIVKCLLEAIVQYGHSLGLPVVFSNVMIQERGLIRLLKEKGFAKSLSLPLAYLDMEWDSFAGYRRYISKLSKNMGRNITKEVNRNRRAGVVISEVADLSDCASRIYVLLQDNYRKHNGLDLPFDGSFLIRLKENLGDGVRVYVAKKRGKIIGTIVVLRLGGRWWTPYVGVDHDASGSDATYFNVCYYSLIRDAISVGAQRIYYGNAMYEMKRKRGCKIARSYIFYKAANRLSQWTTRHYFSIHRYWYKKKFSGVLAPEGARHQVLS